MKIDYWTIMLIIAIVFFIIKINQEQKTQTAVQELFNELTINRTKTLNEICECGHNFSRIKIPNNLGITIINITEEIR